MSKKQHNAASGSVLSWMLLALIGLAIVAWVVLNVHPDSATINTETTVSTSVNLMNNFDNFINNTKSDSLSDITFIRKTYSIAETATVAPKPDAAKYGETTDPAEVRAVIESAAVLLDGQETEWNESIEIMPGSTIKYYCDETLLVICWKEVINRGCYSFAEVKVADGSQLRRAIADNTYGSSKQYYPSDMAKAANAVVAINGDFYSYRSQGITVYQRTLYRFSPAKVDTCFFTADGEMLFSRHGEMTEESQALKFIEDNNVVFAVAFGPILVEDGQLTPVDSYPIGEISITYSRAGIGQLGDKHYLLAVLGEEKEYARRAPVNEFGETMYNKHCINAYTLDGGQTATIVFNDKVFNRVDWNSERTMSDIIYFATALETEGN